MKYTSLLVLGPHVYSDLWFNAVDGSNQHTKKKTLLYHNPEKRESSEESGVSACEGGKERITQQQQIDIAAHLRFYQRSAELTEVRQAQCGCGLVKIYFTKGSLPAGIYQRSLPLLDLQTDSMGV